MNKTKTNEMHEIKVLRKAVKMKQYVLAEKLGIEQSNYANMENGKLTTKKIPEIKKSALEILLPMLEKEINIKTVELKYLQHMNKHFNN